MNHSSQNPLVSIIVPSFNQGRFIRKTLQSILEQDYRPLEVIVIDGASTDETVDVLHEFDAVAEVSWVSEPDSGVVEAVNKGFARAKGEIGAIQSSDDYYLPSAIQTGVAALQADDTLGFVFGDIVKVDANGEELMRTALRPFSLEAVLSIQTWIPQPSTFFRMEIVRELDGWRNEVPYAADTDLWLRMAFVAGALKIDQLLAVRTMHDDQRDAHGDRIVRDFSRMIDELLPLMTAPETLRKAAAAGKLLMANRYLAESGYWIRLARLWKAISIYPPLKRYIPLSARLPGWFPLLYRASGLKRRMLGQGIDK